MEILTNCNYLDLGLRAVVEHSKFLKFKAMDLIFIDMRFHSLEELTISDESKVVLIYPVIPVSLPHHLKKISISLRSSLDEIIRAIGSFVNYKLYRANMAIRHKNYMQLRKMEFTKAEILTIENLLEFNSVATISKVEGVSIKTIYARISSMQNKMNVRSLPQLIIAYSKIRF